MSHHAATLRCPWLVCIAANDQVAKPQFAIETARQAPKGEICIYPDIDHFDIYDGPPHEAVVGGELEFLCRQLLHRSVSGVPKAASAVRGSVCPGKAVMSRAENKKDKVTYRTTRRLPRDGFTEFWANRNPEMTGCSRWNHTMPIHFGSARVMAGTKAIKSRAKSTIARYLSMGIAARSTGTWPTAHAV
jgi:hypothetical protein